MVASPQEIATLAQQYGLDPAYADAVASRESSFDPNAHASKSVYGLFQMNGANRAKYGVPLGSNVETQVRGFADFTNDLKQQMAASLGRQPTSQELYLGHYWGPQRAAGVINGQYAQMPARDVFSPKELAANPNIDPDKPIGETAQTIIGDMGRRTAQYSGGQPTGNGDVPVGNKDAALAQTADLTSYGTGDDTSPAANTSKAPAGPDFTGYGVKPPDAETSAAISSMAADDHSDINDLSKAMTAIGAGASAPAAAAPRPPQVPNPDQDYLQAAMLEKQMGPVGGVGAMPGQAAQANPLLPGASGKATPFQLDPSMFGVAPQPNQQQQA